MKLREVAGVIAAVTVAGVVAFAPATLSAQSPQAPAQSPQAPARAPQAPAQTTMPTVRVISANTQILTTPEAKRATVAAIVDEGTVLEAIDYQPGWYWVLLAADQNGTRHQGWVRARDVEIASKGGPGSGTHDLMQQLTSPAVEKEPDETRIDKMRREVEKRQREYDEAVKAAHPESSTDQPASDASSQDSKPETQKSKPKTHHQSSVPGYELFGGYAYAWDGTDGLGFPGGWIVALSKAVHDSFAIAAEVSGSYRSDSIDGFTIDSARVHTFAAGPEMSRPTQFGRVFGQVLAGVAVPSGDALGLGSTTSAGFALLPGGGVVFPLAGRLGFRVGGELTLAHELGAWVKGFRLSTGVVLTK